MGVKKSYEIKILGQKFVLKTENDETHVKRVADYVNKIFYNIKDHSETISTQNVAILAALNIAEELFCREDQHKTVVENWHDRLTEILP